LGLASSELCYLLAGMITVHDRQGFLGTALLTVDI